MKITFLFFCLSLLFNVTRGQVCEGVTRTVIEQASTDNGRASEQKYHMDSGMFKYLLQENEDRTYFVWYYHFRGVGNSYFRVNNWEARDPYSLYDNYFGGFYTRAGNYYGVNNNRSGQSKLGAQRSGDSYSPLAGSGLQKTGWTDGGHWSKHGK